MARLLSTATIKRLKDKAKAVHYLVADNFTVTIDHLTGAVQSNDNRQPTSQPGRTEMTFKARLNMTSREYVIERTGQVINVDAEVVIWTTELVDAGLATDGKLTLKKEMDKLTKDFMIIGGQRFKIEAADPGPAFMDGTFLWVNFVCKRVGR